MHRLDRSSTPVSAVACWAQPRPSGQPKVKAGKLIIRLGHLGVMTVDRRKKLSEMVEAYDGYMAQLKEVRLKLESSGKDSRSFYPFVERDENQRLTAFRLAEAEVFGEK